MKQLVKFFQSKNIKTYAIILLVCIVLIAISQFMLPQAIYHTSATDSSIVSHWAMNGDATDTIGSNDGTVTGATLTTGKYGQGYEFDGDGDYIIISDWDYTYDEFTGSMWVYYHGGGSEFHTILSNHKDGDYGFEPFIDYDGNGINFRSSPDGTVWHNTDTGEVLSVGEWVHLAFVISSSNRFLYVNGASVWSDDNGGINVPASHNFYIGVCGFGSVAKFFNGTIDEVQVYNTALNADQISMIYANSNYYPSSASCIDGILNGNEESVDCGGACGICSASNSKQTPTTVTPSAEVPQQSQVSLMDKIKSQFRILFQKIQGAVGG